MNKQYKLINNELFQLVPKKLTSRNKVLITKMKVQIGNVVRVEDVKQRAFTKKVKELLESKELVQLNFNKIDGTARTIYGTITGFNGVITAMNWLAEAGIETRGNGTTGNGFTEIKIKNLISIVHNGTKYCNITKW